MLIKKNITFSLEIKRKVTKKMPEPQKFRHFFSFPDKIERFNSNFNERMSYNIFRELRNTMMMAMGMIQRRRTR